MVVVSAYGIDFRPLVVKYPYEVSVQTLFNPKKNFGFSVFGDKHEVKDESAERRWIHCAKMKGNLYSLKGCLFD